MHVCTMWNHVYIILKNNIYIYIRGIYIYICIRDILKPNLCYWNCSNKDREMDMEKKYKQANLPAGCKGCIDRLEMCTTYVCARSCAYSWQCQAYDGEAVLDKLYVSCRHVT